MYGLSPAEASDIAASVDSLPAAALPVVDSREQLILALQQELSYCSCAPNEAIALLQNFLRIARERSDTTDDPNAFANASQKLEAILALDDAPALASWFIYGLQQRDLIWHGFRQTDTWTTDKGRRLLDAMLRFFPG